MLLIKFNLHVLPELLTGLHALSDLQGELFAVLELDLIVQLPLLFRLFLGLRLLHATVGLKAHLLPPDPHLLLQLRHPLVVVCDDVGPRRLRSLLKAPVIAVLTQVPLR